ncbi:MAG: CHAD domain-containing protein [Desulfobacterales bacterium]
MDNFKKFIFKSKCRIPDNIRQIAVQQVLMARNYLTDPPGDDIHAGNHEARKCFKRLRGLLRMARPALGKKLYRRQNICFRDAARLLSAARDAQALVETLDMLEDTYGLQVNFDRMHSLRTILSEQRERLSREQSNLDEHINDVVDTLEESISSIDDWPLADAGSEDLARGVQRVYRRACKGWKLALKKQNPTEMHDWRKRVKYLRYQFQLLKGVDKDWASYWHKGYKKLSNLLGDHHDLVVLREKLDDMDKTGLDPVAECEFRSLLRDMQDSLYQDAVESGAALLKKKPKKFRKKIQKRLNMDAA